MSQVAIRRCAGMLLAAGLSCAAAAQPASPGAKPTEPDAPKEARAVLRQAQDAARKLKAIGYSARVEPGAGVKAQYASVAVKVSLARASGGVWKLHAQGQVNPPKTEGSKAELVWVTYDGITARSVKELDQTIFEHTTTRDDEVEKFFGAYKCDQSVLWELLAPNPYVEAMRADIIVYEGIQQVGGAPCDVIRAEKRVRAGTKKAEEDGAPRAATGSRYYISTEDFLPRKVERLVLGAGAGGAADSKPGETKEQPAGVPEVVVMLSSITTDGDVPGVAFTPDVADDWVRRPEPTFKKDTGKPSAFKAPESRDAGLLGVGDEAPEWKLKDAAGGDVKLSDFKGQIVLMDFWGTWCPPCRAAMPSMQSLHEKYKDKKVVVVGMNYEQVPSADPAKFMRDNKYTYRLVLRAESITGTYKVTGFPTFYLIGADGKILWRASSHSPAHEKEIAAAIDAALGEKK